MDDNSNEKQKLLDSSDQLKLVDISKKDKKGFPFHVGYILGNEFCERYSYYGMRTILVIYLSSKLIDWDDNTATAVYHAFTVLAYLFPLLGAMLADSFLGKYWTILSLSIVYAIGSGINTMSAIKPIGGENLAVHAALASTGLFVIAFGTGGIKPCVSAFGGDQFTADQDNYRRRFFSLFYLAINAGSLVSTFVSPLIRERVKCFGDDCFALAFGIPTALMVIAIILFAIGTPFYTRLEPEGNIFYEVCKTIYRSIKRRWNVPADERNKEHWLDYANDGTNAQLIQDIKYVLKVLVIYIPLPLFWSLFDQQGSRWTLQAVRMNGQIGSVVILPDQAQILNPLIIVTLIPLFEATLYPCLRYFKLNFSPLRRMGAGMWLAGIAFVVAGVVHLMIEENLTDVPRSGESTLRVVNGADCDLTVEGNLWDWNTNPQIVSHGNVSDTLERKTSPGSYDLQFQCEGGKKISKQVNLLSEKSFDIYVYGTASELRSTDAKERQTAKSDSGKAFVGLVNLQLSNITANIGNDEGSVGITFGERHEFKELSQGSYKLKLTIDGGREIVANVDVLTGAAYTYIYTPTDGVKSFKDIYENDVSMFWMIPQYFIITLGEVFLSVTGLEFSYSQAPQSMKSVLTSFWLLTVSIGNIIVLIIAETSLIPSQADEYFLFAGLIAFAAIVFLFLAMRYKYVDESVFKVIAESDDDSIDSSLDSDLGKINPAFIHNTHL